MLILREEKIIDNDNIIGSNIRRIRLEKGIGQTELVKQLQLMDVDITRETLVKIESGKQHIKLEQLNALITILKVEYKEIFISKFDNRIGEKSDGKIDNWN